MRAGPSTPDGWRSGTLRAAGPGVWLEIHERAPDLTLDKTATALATLDGELAALLRAPPPEPGGWLWWDTPGLEAVSAERVRGPDFPFDTIAPGTTDAVPELWLMWDGQPPERWPPAAP